MQRRNSQLFYMRDVSCKGSKTSLRPKNGPTSDINDIDSKIIFIKFHFQKILKKYIYSYVIIITMNNTQKCKIVTLIQLLYFTIQ